MKVVVFCNAGLSSGMIVSKMQKLAPQDEIVAYQATKMAEELPGADVVLLSPALRYLLDKAKELARPQGIPCDVIDMKAYGLCDGAAVYKQVQKMYAQKK